MNSNLHARQFDDDLATNIRRIGRTAPLAPIDVGDTVNTNVYFTSGAVLMESLTLELDFNSALVEFVSFEAGTDGCGGALLEGELKSDDQNVVLFDGTTTSYASGNDWRFTTVTFRSTGLSDVAVFGGAVAEVADSNAARLLPSNAEFEADSGVMLVIGTGSNRVRRVCASQHVRERDSTRPQRSGPECTAVDPLLGDVNLGCQFPGIDALLIAQCILINDDPTAV